MRRVYAAGWLVVTMILAGSFASTVPSGPGSRAMPGYILLSAEAIVKLKTMPCGTPSFTVISGAGLCVGPRMKFPSASAGALAPSGNSFALTYPAVAGSRVGGVGRAGLTAAGVGAGACADAGLKPETPIVRRAIFKQRNIMDSGRSYHQRISPEAHVLMIVDDAGGLHPRIDNDRPHELEATFFQCRGHLFRERGLCGQRALRALDRLPACDLPVEFSAVLARLLHFQVDARAPDGRFNLGARADNSGVGEKPCYVRLCKSRYRCGVEARECLPKRIALPQDSQP